VVWGPDCGLASRGVTEQNHVMSSPIHPDPKLPAEQHPAAGHVSVAQRLLHALKEKVGEHPELTGAITELELALSKLSLKTAGML
jgi:hypothetical protein